MRFDIKKGIAAVGYAFNKIFFLFRKLGSKKVDPVLTVDFAYLYFYGIADIHDILYLLYPALVELGDMNEAIDPDFD